MPDARRARSPSPAAEVRWRRARILTWLSDWQTGEHLLEDDDPPAEARYELECTWQVERTVLGDDVPRDWPRLVALVEQFVAFPDADLLLEIAALLAEHAQRVEAHGRTPASLLTHHEPLVDCEATSFALN